MEHGFIDILQKMVKAQGCDALKDTKKCKSLLADYTKNEYKKECRLLIQAVEAGVPKVIDGVENLAACKKGKIKELEEEYGLSTVVATDIVDTIAFVLRGDTTNIQDAPLAAPQCPATPTPIKGKKRYDNGSVYDGDLVNGIRSGKGKGITANGGGVYEGDWVNDTFNGKGKITLANGGVYEGDFVFGRFTKGKTTLASGAVYEGDFVDFKLTGKGKSISSDGTVYEGDFVNYKRNGKGKCTYSNGAIYEGDWIDNKKHGKGKYTRVDGIVQEGQFENNKYVGSWANEDLESGVYLHYKRGCRISCIGVDSYMYGERIPDVIIRQGEWEFFIGGYSNPNNSTNEKDLLSNMILEKRLYKRHKYGNDNVLLVGNIDMQYCKLLGAIGDWIYYVYIGSNSRSEHEIDYEGIYRISTDGDREYEKVNYRFLYFVEDWAYYCEYDKNNRNEGKGILYRIHINGSNRNVLLDNIDNNRFWEIKIDGKEHYLVSQNISINISQSIINKDDSW